MRKIEIDILLFAQARELAGQDRVRLALPTDTTAGGARELLAAARPELKSLLARCRMAVNHRIAADDTPLERADEVAVIPPVAGG